MRTRPIGSLFGASGGLAFALANAGPLPAPLIWRVAAIIVFAAIGWFVVARGPDVHQDPPSRQAIRTYGIAVVAMVVAIPVGAGIITNVLDRPDAVLVWVVFVVGAHFLPFARAFGLPVFDWLGISLMGVSIIGAIPTLAFDSATAASGTGVAAGFVMLFFSAIGPSVSQRSAAQSG